MTAFLLEFIWKGVRCAFFFMHERSGFILLSLDRDLVLFPPPFFILVGEMVFLFFFSFFPSTRESDESDDIFFCSREGIWKGTSASGPMYLLCDTERLRGRLGYDSS